MFCTSCDKEDKELNVKKSICNFCGFNNSHVFDLISEDKEIEDKFRTVLACARRCVILFAVMSLGYGADNKGITIWLKKEKLWRYVSKKEKLLFSSKVLNKQQIINVTWRAEALYLLLWWLNKINSASNLSEVCDVDKIKEVCDFYLKDTNEFIKSCIFRKEYQIYNLKELIYDSHWKVREAQINNRKIPNNLNSSVVQERHYAINWSMGYCGQDWDDVTTDT